MDKFKEMYLKSFNKITDTIEDLQEFQKKMEEEYIEYCEFQEKKTQEALKKFKESVLNIEKNVKNSSYR